MEQVKEILDEPLDRLSQYRWLGLVDLRSVEIGLMGTKAQPNAQFTVQLFLAGNSNHRVADYDGQFAGPPTKLRI